MPKKLYIIAGEASGDLHGARLIEALKKLSAEPIEIYGVGGSKIRATGAVGFLDLASHHVIGFFDAIKNIWFFKKTAATLLKDIERTRPDLVVLIDNPGFNLHLAKKIHALGIPIVYYIAPQLWAWGKNRIFKIKKYISKVLVVFDFEKKLYEEYGVPVAWVGHPLKEIVLEKKSDRALLSASLETKKWRIALLPGSRTGELKRLLPVFSEVVKIISDKYPQSHFSLIKASTLSREDYAPFGLASNVTLVEENAYAAIASSHFAIVCSGTATLECALLGTPMIIVYKDNFLSFAISKMLVRIKFIGLPNIVLGKECARELLQANATPQKIAAEMLRILENADVWNARRESLEEIPEKLGGSKAGVSLKAAEEILKLLS